MLGMDDERWAHLKGGYRDDFDLRPWLALLEAGTDDESVWEALWENLHHQGDVGEASYAAVPPLVEIYDRLTIFDWNAYGLVVIIELCRMEDRNPPLPAWLEREYFASIQKLAQIGIRQFHDVSDPEDVRAILSVLALSKGARLHAKFLLNCDDNELKAMQERL